VTRPGLAARSRAALGRIADDLEPAAYRGAVLTVGVLLPVGLHLLLGDPRLAWIAAPVVMLAGLAAGSRTALTIAVVSVVGHAVVDVVTDTSASELLGILVRSVALLLLALAGAAGADMEAQRDRAMRRAVTEDPRTGLVNVRTFCGGLARLRDEGTPFAILVADVRGMRALNEEYGHPTGTEAMRAMAHVLRRSVGADVLASRLGSDEIAVALVGDDRDRCRQIVEHVVSRLPNERVALPDGDRFEVHAAYGVARYPEDGEDEVAVLRAADRAKDRAKAGGLDRVDTASGEPA